MSRKDGKPVKALELDYLLLPRVMVERNDALNLAEFSVPYQPMHEYVLRKRKEGVNMSHLTVVMAAYTRVIAKYPAMNRFCVNKKLYARNEFNVSMVILKPNGEGSMEKVNLHPADTVLEVSDKVNDYIKKTRETSDGATEQIATTLAKNKWLLNIGLDTLIWLDKHNMLPRSIIDASPMHASVGITNLASIGISHIYHHIYNFGTISIFIAMGKVIEEPYRKPDGTCGFRQMLPFGIVMDERMCDGLYMAKMLKLFKHYMTHPEELEEKPDEVNIEIPYRTDKYSN